MAKHLHFSKAARELHVSQSALSQRIANLEQQLGHALFVRQAGKVTLTNLGGRLLQFAKARADLEEEFLAEVESGTTGELTGTIRLAAYSSILRSVIVPALSPLLRAHPKLRCEFQSRELSELPDLLMRAEVDLIVLNHHFSRPEVERVTLGTEENILIESSVHPERKHYFLDHDPEDQTTANFFHIQSKPAPSYERIYCDDVYGILDGVKQGLGRAIVSKHLLEKDMPIKRPKGFKSLTSDVVLHHLGIQSGTRLKGAVIIQLVQEVKKFL